METTYKFVLELPTSYTNADFSYDVACVIKTIIDLMCASKGDTSAIDPSQIGNDLYFLVTLYESTANKEG